MRTLSLSVLQLNQYIKRIIDAEEMLAGIGLFGEVSNFKISGGNAFFDLKEDGASIACMMFGDSVVELKNGRQVMLFGRLSFYAKTGKLSFIAHSAEEIGKGALYEKYLELKAKLEKEGLFDERLKKQIPKYSKKIGLVTSETGAVLHDILKVARKKNTKTDFVLYPVKVQGEGAEQTIAKGIDYFSDSDVDMVIVARGGGSFEDLAPFNTEVVARSIFACKKPLISAVGHETDFSISDFAADLRCATPSVASEVAVFDLPATWERIKLLLQIVDKDTCGKIEENKNYLMQLASSNQETAKLCVDAKFQELKSCLSNIAFQTETAIVGSQNQFDKLFIRIEKDNPLALLKRGYIKGSKAGKTIASVDEVECDDLIDLQFFDGKAKAKITSKEKKQ